MYTIKKLTKENFWNELNAKYPVEMLEFCLWIDEYKKRIDWNNQFGEKMKYHHLPIAMQVGIFLEFTFETSKQYHLLEECNNITSMEDLVEEIREWFYYEHMNGEQGHSRKKVTR